MSKAKIQEIAITTIDTTIRNKINSFVDKYDKYPKYLKLPLWISNCMKKAMKDIKHFNLDYNYEMLTYRDLIVCETITIDKLEEIEVF